MPNAIRSLMRLIALAVPFALACEAVPAFAQQEKGNKTLAGYGYVQFETFHSIDQRTRADTSQTDPTGLIGVQFGGFATEHLELGALVQVTSTHPPDLSDNVMVGFVAFYTKYYFGKGRTKPYLGLQLGFDSRGGAGNGSAGFVSGADARANFTAGLRHYVTQHAAPFVELSYGKTAEFLSSSTKADSYPSVVFGFAIVF